MIAGGESRVYRYTSVLRLESLLAKTQKLCDLHSIFTKKLMIILYIDFL